jgi:hypothetical protein
MTMISFDGGRAERLTNGFVRVDEWASGSVRCWERTSDRSLKLRHGGGTVTPAELDAVADLLGVSR